jgi:hypothetical protein
MPLGARSDDRGALHEPAFRWKAPPFRFVAVGASAPANSFAASWKFLSLIFYLALKSWSGSVSVPAPALIGRTVHPGATGLG